MEILVHDTLTPLRPLFTQRMKARDLLPLSQERLTGEHGVWSLVEPAAKRQGEGGYGVMEAAAQDGYDVMMFQQGWGLFNPTRRPEASAWAFDQFAAADLLETIKLWLCEFRMSFPGWPAPARLEVCALPADPANRSLMVMNHGLSGFAGVPGYLALLLWPSRGNRDRLGPVLARLFAHNLRRAVQPVQTLGDLLVLEGLAAAFVAEQFPAVAAAPWLVPFRAPADWDGALQQIAESYGAASYAELRLNVYGITEAVGSERPPAAHPLADDELAYARELLAGALGETDARLQAAYLYGDDLVARQGHPTVGMLPYAGFEVAYRAVQAYLQRSGQSAAGALGLPTAEILRASGYFVG